MPLQIHHLNCGSMHAPPFPPAISHCLLLQDNRRLVLVDTGLGVLDVEQGAERLGRPVVDAVGFLLRPDEPAVRQLERRGLPPEGVSDIILTHADLDHAGGLADFPVAQVHLSEAEQVALRSGNPRYLPAQFAHDVRWATYGRFDRDWFGLPACRLELGLSAEVLLVWLPGHTLGHCGVAIGQDGHWLLHAGDAYYLRAQLESEDHPVEQLATARADDDAPRRESLAHLRRLHRDHDAQIRMIGYHDPAEFPSD